MLLFAFSRGELWRIYRSYLSYVIKNKQIDHINKIMSKRHDIFTETFTISFSNAGKTVNVPEFEFGNSKRPSFGDPVNVAFIL